MLTKPTIFRAAVPANGETEEGGSRARAMGSRQGGSRRPQGHAAINPQYAMGRLSRDRPSGRLSGQPAKRGRASGTRLVWQRPRLENESARSRPKAAPK